MNVDRFGVLGLLASYALLCGLLFTPMISALHSHWTTANDLDAGYLLLAVVVYMLWQLASPASTDRSASYDKPLRIAALVVFVIAIAAASVAAITANKAVTLALLVAAFAPLCVWVLGTRWLASSIHACAVLLMATPIWFVLVPQLQELTASAVNWLLSRGRWPIFIEGNLITLPQGLLEIAAGCAGLKFLQTALALTLIEGFVARRSFRAMAVIGAFAVLLAIVSNWLRVSAITLLALKLDPNHPWVADHNWVGWVLFGLMFGPLFYWLGSVEFFARKPVPAAAGGAYDSNTDDQSSDRTSADSLGPMSMGATAVRAGLGLVLAFGMAGWLASAAEGATSARIGDAQIAAVKKFCTAAAVRPLTSFPGATLSVDCLTKSGRYLALRGFLRELQEQEVINPVNELLPGLGLLEYRVIAQPGANATDAPAIVQVPGQATQQIAYGFYATGAWSGNARDYKIRSLLRPFVPGPVYALVVIERSGSEGAFDRHLDRELDLKAEFERIAGAMQAASSP